MKICLISFDHWNYDAHIVDALRKKGIDAYHINIGKYKHTSKLSRFKNSLSKIFLGKNPKLELRQKFIVSELEKRGFQDQILVINPELIDREYHLKIKKFTKRYIAYLYDSLARHPINSLIEGIFDDIYSFDKTDIKNYNFKEVNNYIYFDTPKKDRQNPKFDVCYLASYDSRIPRMNAVANELEKLGKSYQFLIVGKKSWIKKLLKLPETKTSVVYRMKRIHHADIPKFYQNARIILDLVRENQSGLSFRIFEAIALEKKVITDNENIVNYDFYNPNNILVLNNTNNLNLNFFETPYEKIPEDIYYRYTLDSWVTIVFEL